MKIYNPENYAYGSVYSLAGYICYKGFKGYVALETLITDISLGSLFKRVDTAPYNSKGTRYAKELFYCRSTFYLEFYQSESQLDQCRRNKNDFIVATVY